MPSQRFLRRGIAIVGATLAVSSARAETAQPETTGTCGGVSVTLPFADVPGNSTFFCAIASAYLSGLTAGTSPTAYTPSTAVARDQMAAFTSRTLDQALRRGSRRAALERLWTPKTRFALSSTAVGDGPSDVKSDGTDLWVANHDSGSVSRIRGSDGKLLETWTGATNATAILIARGKIYVSGYASADVKLWSIDPSQPAGAVTPVATGLTTSNPFSMAFDGSSIWIAHGGAGTGLTKVGFGLLCNPCVTHFTAGLGDLRGVLFDGANIWATDVTVHKIHRINADGTVDVSVPVENFPTLPTFDGANIWVPGYFGNGVTVVRAKDAAGNPLAAPFVLRTLSGNGLDGPAAAAFDGERVLIANDGGSVSTFRALDMASLDVVDLASGQPANVCSDGLSFWIVDRANDRLLRF